MTEILQKKTCSAATQLGVSPPLASSKRSFKSLISSTDSLDFFRESLAQETSTRFSVSCSTSEDTGPQDSSEKGRAKVKPLMMFFIVWLFDEVS